MKRNLTSFILILALAVSMLSPAFAAEDLYTYAAPSGITAVEGGYLITDVYNKVIWKVADDGTATRIAGQVGVRDMSGEPIGATTDGTLLTALFQNPWGIVPFLDGYLVSEPDANVIRFFDDKSVQTAAGSGKEGNLDGVGVKATFSFPTGLAAGEDGEVYIADTGNGSIRCLDKDGAVTTFFTGLSDPTGIYWLNGVLYVAETGAHCISKIEDGTRTVIVGLDSTDGYTDGYVKAARLRDPQGVIVGEDGTVYIADTGNHAVRCLRGEQVTTLLCDDTVGMPRGLLLQGDTLLVTDPFSRTVLKTSVTLPKFEDVTDTRWFAPAVYDAVQRGLFRGVGDNLFDPLGTTNRAMLAQMLANLQQQLDRDILIVGSAELNDVSAGKWYTDVVLWSVDHGFIAAAGGTFDPLREITREEMTVALFRFAASVGADTSPRGDLSAFKDADLVTTDAVDAMSWAVSVGLIRGISADELSPHTTTTRAQMVQVMIRFMDLLQKN